MSLQKKINEAIEQIRMQAQEPTVIRLSNYSQRKLYEECSTQFLNRATPAGYDTIATYKGIPVRVDPTFEDGHWEVLAETEEPPSESRLSQRETAKEEFMEALVDGNWCDTDAIFPDENEELHEILDQFWERAKAEGRNENN